MAAAVDFKRFLEHALCAEQEKPNTQLIQDSDMLIERYEDVDTEALWEAAEEDGESIDWQEWDWCNDDCLLHEHGWNSYQVLLVKGADWTGAEYWDRPDWTVETSESMDAKLREGTAKAFRMWLVADTRTFCDDCSDPLAEGEEGHEDEETCETFCGECWAERGGQ